MTFLEKTASLYALLSLGFIIIFSLFGLYSGYNLYSTTKERENWEKASATVSSVKCSTYKEQSGSRYEKRIYTKYNCALTVSYMVKGVAYTNVLQVDGNDTEYTKGDTLDIYYDTLNPKKISKDLGSVTFNGIILFVSLVGFVAGTYGFKYCWKHNCSTLGSVFFFSDLIRR